MPRHPLSHALCSLFWSIGPACHGLVENCGVEPSKFSHTLLLNLSLIFFYQIFLQINIFNSIQITGLLL